jgi:hypothetical protein
MNKQKEKKKKKEKKQPDPYALARRASILFKTASISCVSA